MKSKYNNLYDPLQANNIVINGQLIIVNLIIRLIPFIELLQTNTDGLIIKYKDKEKVLKILETFSKEFNLNYKLDYPKKLIQKDVNNYILVSKNGTICKGIYKSNKKLPLIVSKAIKGYYEENKDIYETIFTEFKNQNFKDFQLVYFLKNDDAYFLNENGQKMEDKAVRIFATKTGQELYKKTNKINSKLPNSSSQSMIYNDDLEALKQINLNIDYYIEQTKKFMF